MKKTDDETLFITEALIVFSKQVSKIGGLLPRIVLLSYHKILHSKRGTLPRRNISHSGTIKELSGLFCS